MFDEVTEKLSLSLYLTFVKYSLLALHVTPHVSACLWLCWTLFIFVTGMFLQSSWRLLCVFTHLCGECLGDSARLNPWPPPLSLCSGRAPGVCDGRSVCPSPCLRPHDSSAVFCVCVCILEALGPRCRWTDGLGAEMNRSWMVTWLNYTTMMVWKHIEIS